MHIRKFLSGIFEKSRSSLLLLGIDSRHYACIRGGYIALKERAQPFSKIPLILAYGLQDATVLSRWDGFSRVGALEVQPHQLQYSPQTQKEKSSLGAIFRFFLAYVMKKQYLCTLNRNGTYLRHINTVRNGGNSRRTGIRRREYRYRRYALPRTSALGRSQSQHRAFRED